MGVYRLCNSYTPPLLLLNTWRIMYLYLNPLFKYMRVIVPGLITKSWLNQTRREGTQQALCGSSAWLSISPRPQQNRNNWQILPTLANPIRSESNREAAVLHSSCAVLPPASVILHDRHSLKMVIRATCFAYDLLLLCIPGAQEKLCRRQVADSQLLPSLGKSTELHYTWPEAQCSCTDHSTTWWACRQVPSPSRD